MGTLLAERARAWRRQFLNRALADGAARLSCAAVFSMAAGIWLDQAATLPQRARLGLLAALGVGLGAGVYRWLWRPWRDFDLGETLDAVERRFPELALYLRSAWELSRGPAAPGTSEELRRAHVVEAERLLAIVPRAPVFPWKLDARLRGAGILAALAAGSLIWAPSGALDRLLRPWRDVPLERFLRVVPGDARGDWGRPVTIIAEWLPGAPAGRARNDLSLWVQEGGGWRRAAWDKEGGNEQRFTVDELTAPLRYRLAWRDLASRAYVLTPVLAPRLESLRARVQGSGLPAQPLTAAEPLLVMRGALVSVSGRSNQPLSRAILALSSQPQPIPMRQAQSGEYQASFVVQEDATLRFDLETPDGRSDRDPLLYSLRALADQPPAVELLSPQEPVLASPADLIPIAYSAKDDGGLTEISLILRAGGRPPREIPLQRPAGRREFAGDYALELAGLPLGRLEFQLKAVDNASPPQSALSAKGVVELADLEAAHAQSEQLWRKAEQSLKAAGDTAEKLRRDLAAGKPAGERDVAALPQEWERAAQDLKQLADALRQDAYANPGLPDEMKNAADGLSSAQRDELPEARQAARAGPSSEAAQRHERLARRLEQARKLLRQGRALQSLEDFYQETGRLSQANASIEAGLEALASGAAPSEEAKAKLDAALRKIQSQMEALQKALESLPTASPDADSSRKAIEMPVQSARENADALARALARGDYQEAARLARKLSEDLAKIQQAVGQAASASAAAALPRELQQRLDRAKEAWSRVVDEQAKLLERTQKIEDSKVAGRLEAQRGLLAQLERRQSVAIATAAARAGFPPDALESMRQAQGEFARRKVEAAPALLRAAAARARSGGFEPVAREEEAIAAKLAEGAEDSSDAAGPQAAQAGRDQAALKAKTGRLQAELESLERDSGASAGDAIDQLSAAQGEQGAASESLGRRDSAAALPRQEKALELLSQGQGQMGQSGPGGPQREALLSPFKRPAGVLRVMRSGGGSSGAQLGFVPLPSVRDYLPPKELREELERSLREGRPASQDALIKEYFKRIAQ